MTHHLSIDIETYSDIDLKKAGLYRYVQSPNFEILLFAYSWDGNPVQIVDLALGETLPGEVIAALADPEVTKHAYNAAFEWCCLNKFWPSPINQWRCSMVRALYCGYPMGLGNVCEAMGLPQDKRKLYTGSGLIRTFCIPHKPTRANGNRTRTLPSHEPERWQLFKEYCKQDVVAEMDVARRLEAFPLPENEQRLWELDMLMNAYGVAVDQKVVDGALWCSSLTTAALMEEATNLSGLDNPNSTSQLKAWLEEELEEEFSDGLPDMSKATVKQLLDNHASDDTVRRMLEIRQELGKTSVKKYAAMHTAACQDSRVRGLLQYYGANRTGRWAGRLVQVQNLPQNHLPHLELARQLVSQKQLDMIKLVFGNVPDTLSQLIRTAFIPSPGNILLVADFSAIEARIIAWLAGEQWVMDVFASHGKIYEATASQMFGVPIEKIAKGNEEYALRQKGKVATLALGYQGGRGALIKMGALNMGLTEEELPDIVSRWRRANKRICELWYRLEDAAVACLQTGEPQLLPHNIIIRRESQTGYNLDFMTVQLPSGRKLFYVHPKLSPGENGRHRIEYAGMDQEKKTWGTVETYGGKLVENITQAVARDCLAVCLQRLVSTGYPIVMHVHDEVIIDAPASTELQPVLDIMKMPITWAPGLLLKGDGFTCDYYKKE